MLIIHPSFYDSLHLIFAKKHIAAGSPLSPRQEVPGANCKPYPSYLAHLLAPPVVGDRVIQPRETPEELYAHAFGENAIVSEPIMIVSSLRSWVDPEVRCQPCSNVQKERPGYFPNGRQKTIQVSK